MSGPSQRAAARQAARRGSSAPASGARRSATPRTPRGSGSPGAPRAATAAGRSKAAVVTAAAAVRERPTLTGRAVVLAAVAALLVFSLAVPLRELFRQRGEINELHAQNAATQVRVDQLTLRAERLEDPAYVTSLIRERLHYVLPGEVGYVVLDPTEAPAPAAASDAAPHVPWYSSLWSAIETTDQAGAPAGGTRIPIRPNAPR